jgi:hypothetical protein
MNWSFVDLEEKIDSAHGGAVCGSNLDKVFIAKMVHCINRTGVLISSKPDQE